MKVLYSILIFSLLLGACSSSKLVDQYTNPDNADYRVNKVLVIGMTPDGGLQKQFEFSLAEALKKHKIDAVKSVDYFGEEIIVSNKTDKELELLKNELLVDGFDAVFFSRIIGRDSKVSLFQSYRNLVRTFEVYGDYSSKHPVAYGSESYESKPIVYTETLLYCLCPQNENDLIWKGNIEVANTSNAEESIQDYVRILLKSLKKNNHLPSK